MPVLAAADYASVAFGAVLLGHALQISSGFYSPAALLWLTLSLAAILAGACRVPSRLGVVQRERVVAGVLYAGVLSNFVALAVTSPAFYLEPPGPGAHPVFLAGLAAALAAATLMTIRPNQARAIWFPCLLVIAFLLGRWLIRASPDPGVDVITVHRSALIALVHGRSPYSLVWPNIYGRDDAYPPGFAHDGYVYLGFPYPPASLLLSAVARAFARDVRYAPLAGLVIGAGAAGWLPRRRLAPLAAALVLFTPRVFFVLEQGWTEPLTVCFLGILLFLAARSIRGQALAAGVLMALKQHMAVLVPLLAWYRQPRGDSRRYLLQALAVTTVLTLPFAIWDPAGFWRSLVLVQLREPLRHDSLSYLNWVSANGWQVPGALLAVVPLAALAAGLAISWKTLPQTPSGLSLSLGLTLLLVFSVAPKAFCNYYFLALAAVAFAIAAADDDPVALPASPRGARPADRSAPP
jgi:hypothetical protein